MYIVHNVILNRFAFFHKVELDIVLYTTRKRRSLTKHNMKTRVL
jgi:hypothetical protein